MSNHRPRTDPGPPIPTIVASALLTLAIATISAWIILGNGPTDGRHITGFLLGNTLAVVTFGQTVMWASERATAQARIRRFKELQEAQDQQRASHQRSRDEWDRAEKAFMGSRGTAYVGQQPVAPRTPASGGSDQDWLEPWVTAQTEVLHTGEAAETQVLATGDPAETQVIDPAVAQTQVLHTGDPARTEVPVVDDPAAAAETQVIPTTSDAARPVPSPPARYTVYTETPGV